MASSSVSQEDVENDYEKLERRSRIRTARARQINPQGCRMESATSERFSVGPTSLPPIGIEIEESLSELHLDTLNTSPYSVGGAEVQQERGGGDTSPKRGGVASTCGGVGKKEVGRGGHIGLGSKLHNLHGNKGKQQRDRRKLREKRRSTGVVHLASTESTGGSTTEGEDGEPAIDMCSETKRNTQQNESIGETVNSSGLQSPAQDATAPGRGQVQVQVSHHSPIYTSHPVPSRPRLRDKSPRSEDLEADDEQGDKTDNDHDSINLSESSSATSVVPGVVNGTHSVGLLTGCVVEGGSNSSTSTPVLRPTTPVSVGVTADQTVDNLSVSDLQRALAEKDKRIQYLEIKIEQLTQDTTSILVDHQKLKEENSALLRALSNLKK